MRKNIELGKTIVLWMLFLSSIALVVVRYNLIGVDSAADVGLRWGNTSRIFEQVLLPSDITVRFSKYDFTKINQNKKKYVEDEKHNLRYAFTEKNSLKKLKIEEYKEWRKEKSITFIYDGLPSRYLNETLEFKNSPISNIGTIRKITFLLEEPKILFLTEKGFYVLERGKKNTFLTLEKLQARGYNKYYPIFENINDDNDMIFPLEYAMTMSNISTINILENMKILDIAKNIFRERLDFTSSLIQKNGVYFYSYNNGQEILKITNEGKLDYTKEVVDGADADLDISTKNMLLFLREIGIDYDKIVIDSVKRLPTEQGNGYDFYIKYKYGDFIVDMGKEKESGCIRVKGNTVVNCSIYLRYPDQAVGIEQVIMDPSKVLNNEIDTFKKITKLEEVQDIIKNIRNVRLLYNMNDMYELEPIWRIKIDRYEFFMQAVTGEMLRYAVVEN